MSMTALYRIWLGIVALLCAVCVHAGYLMSYWNIAFFPTACTDGVMSDKTNYDTMARIAGSSAQIALALKEVKNVSEMTYFVSSWT